MNLLTRSLSHIIAAHSVLVSNNISKCVRSRGVRSLGGRARRRVTLRFPAAAAPVRGRHASATTTSEPAARRPLRVTELVLESTCKGFSCGSGECISALWACDGVYDCADRSDETSERVCRSKTAKQLRALATSGKACETVVGGHGCDDGACVPAEAACDGLRDCRDGSDEGPFCANCTRPGSTLSTPRFSRSRVSGRIILVTRPLTRQSVINTYLSGVLECKHYHNNCQINF
ncbi:Sortilin-related receptor [Eumeta japonica]|uniref:Sortilin-related receptor n=1 Tax=Eumeta variegata TaxID=151549 RepID=A0A4C1WT69_EUMVA|nr:Sortilin-related receptor [Eumeta japonica]